MKTPKRHGLYRRDDDPYPLGSRWPCFYSGISSLFHHVQQVSSNRSLANTLQQLVTHHGETVKRLLHALDLLQTLIQKWRHMWSHDYETYFNSAINVESGMAADSILAYLNMFVDDIGRVIPYVYESEPTSVDGFSSLKGIVQQKGRDTKRKTGGDGYRDLKPLFDELDASSSWWRTAFERGEGIRQRLVHYTDLVWFTGSCEDSNITSSRSWTTRAFLGDYAHTAPPIDFINVLRTVLHGLCEWLDRLECELRKPLDRRAAASDVKFSQFEGLYRVGVPVKLPTKEPLEVPELDFLYLPRCEGSGSLKTTIKPVRVVIPNIVNRTG